MAQICHSKDRRWCLYQLQAYNRIQSLLHLVHRQLHLAGWTLLCFSRNFYFSSNKSLWTQVFLYFLQKTHLSRAQSYLKNCFFEFGSSSSEFHPKSTMNLSCDYLYCLKTQNQWLGCSSGYAFCLTALCSHIRLRK